MTLDENELCMIEQLCYLDSNVAKAAVVKGFYGMKPEENLNPKTIEDLLVKFDDTALSNLEALGDKEVGASCISGKEWADTIRYIKGNEKLILIDIMEKGKWSREKNERN